MGLMSKIEDKLGGSKHDDQNKLEKSGRKSYEDGGNSRIQNPVSSHEKRAANSQEYKGSGAVDRDGYGTNASGSQGYGQQSSDGYDENRGPRQPFDPYSSKGQRAAANAVTNESSHGHHGHGHHGRSNEAGYGSTGADQDQYSSSRRNESSIPSAGGQRIGESDSGYGSGAHTGSGHQSGHHYGRDAAVAGGVGTAGIGAYEANKMHSGGRESGAMPHGSYDGMQSTGGQRYADPTTAARMGQSGGSGGYGQRQGGPSEYESQGRSSYEAPGSGMTSGGMGSSGMPGHDSHNIASGTSNVPSEPSGLPQAKKMGGAYERGYQDAMEHMKAEMQGK